MKRTYLGAVVAIAILLPGCGQREERADHPAGHGGWSATAWGAIYEIFAECDPLVAGRTAKAHTHVTVLSDFSPLRTGTVTAVLSANGREQRFAQGTAARDGIFSVEITPDTTGTYALSYHVESAAGSETIAAGLVKVSSAATAATDGDHGHEHGSSSTPSVSFLKEQQWRTPFRTEGVATGSLGESVTGPARVRAPAGAEAVLTAPLDGVVAPGTKLHAGLEVARDGEVMRLAPRAPANVNLPELESELRLARSRLERLESLLELGAVSRAEVETARARVAALEPRVAAARGESGAGGVSVRAPFAGRVVDVAVVPGQAVSAGDVLARILKVPPVWIEVSLQSGDSGRITSSPAGLILTHGGAEPIELTGETIKLVSISPAVDAETGTVAAIFEAARVLPVPVGTSVEAEVILPGERSGVVVPASAVVDDAGVSVVYQQIEGESFVRREVTIEARQGSRVLVKGLEPRMRIVTVGGAAIRRADIMSSGEVEGHVH